MVDFNSLEHAWVDTHASDGYVIGCEIAVRSSRSSRVRKLADKEWGSEKIYLAKFRILTLRHSTKNLFKKLRTAYRQLVTHNR